MNQVGQSSIRRLRNRLYNCSIDLPSSFFHKEKTGLLVLRITDDVGIINEMVSNVINGAIGDCFTIVEKGWHDVLMAREGEYYKRYPMQFKNSTRSVQTGSHEIQHDNRPLSF